jgi:hypothetical protein
VDKTLLKMLVGIPVSSRESQDVTDQALPGWEYFWELGISWNLPLLIREKILKAEVFLARKSLIRISDIPGFPAGDGNHSLAFTTVYTV